MAINRPTTKTIISTATWGVPITDAVNANTTDVTNLKTATNATAWQNLPLMNGWSAFGSGYIQPRFRKIGDVVYLEGNLKIGTQPTYPGQIQAGTLPAGYRPVSNIIFPALFGGADGWGGSGRVDVWSNGIFNVVSSGAMLGAHSITSFVCVYQATQ
jgi:hypothetical protein